MFGVDSSELFLVAMIALLLIGPKDLPTPCASVATGSPRSAAWRATSVRESRAMIRDAELEEMEKQLGAENERIMQRDVRRDAQLTPGPAAIEGRHGAARTDRPRTTRRRTSRPADPKTPICARPRISSPPSS